MSCPESFPVPAMYEVDRISQQRRVQTRWSEQMEDGRDTRCQNPYEAPRTSRRTETKCLAVKHRAGSYVV